MLFRILSILTLGTLVFSINASALAQATSVLPTCNPFAGGWIYPSPTAAQDNTFFAAGEWAMPGGYVRYLLKSADRGLTWQRTSDLPFIENYRARIDFSQNYAVDQTLSVTFKTGTNISTDGGQTWRVVTFPRPGPNAFALGDAQHLYLGYGREIPPNSKVPMELIFSSDGGQNWQTIPMGFETDEIAVSPEFAHDRTLLIALGLYHYNGGLRISTDAGLTWLAADAGIELSGMGLAALSFSPAYASDRTIFLVDIAEREIVYKSADAGMSWQPLDNPNVAFGSRPKLLISLRYAADQTLWYTVYNRVTVSRDGGQTWQQPAYPVWLQAAAEYCQSGGGCGVELFGEAKQSDAARDTYSLYRSYDYGQTWCYEKDNERGKTSSDHPYPVRSAMAKCHPIRCSGPGRAAIAGLSALGAAAAPPRLTDDASG